MERVELFSYFFQLLLQAGHSRNDNLLLLFFSMQWKIINEVLNHKQDICVVMATGQLNLQTAYNIIGSLYIWNLSLAVGLTEYDLL